MYPFQAWNPPWHVPCLYRTWHVLQVDARLSYDTKATMDKALKVRPPSPTSLDGFGYHIQLC